MALQSPLFAGDLKLEAAAVSHPAHIVPGSRGEHVKKIQEALNKAIDAGLVVDGVYGPATSAAVEKFKRSFDPPILNFAGKIDNIVGIKTMAALDEEMRPKGRGLDLDFIVDDVTLVDVVVNLQGAPGLRLLPAEDAIPQSFLANTHTQVQNDKLGRKFLRHKSSGNLVFRLAHTTNDIGDGALGTLFMLRALIFAMLLGKDPDNGNALMPGKLCIHGSSSGGRNAIAFAGLMAEKGFTPHFVASIDASFFQADTRDRPVSDDEPVFPIPNFPLAVAAGRFAVLVNQIPNKHNFFQAQGNHAKRVFNPFSNEKFLYTSKMSGGLEEIHGRIPEFTNHLIPISTIFGMTDEQFHEFADPAGRRDAQQMIAVELAKT